MSAASGRLEAPPGRRRHESALSHLVSSLTAAARAAEALAALSCPAEEWTAAASGSLLELMPAARLALAARADGGPPATVVRAADGSAAPDAAEAVRAEFRRADGFDAAARPSRALAAAFGPPCLAAGVRDGGPWALLAVALPPDAAPGMLGAAEASLTVLAQSLLQGRRRLAAEAERDELARLALLGQAASGLAHDVRNLLSGINLQVSVLHMRLEVKHHGDLDVIRRQALHAADLLQALGRFSVERSRGFRPVDLNRAVAELLHVDAALAARVRLTPPSAAVPPVRGSAGAVKALLRLLLSAAAARSAPPLTVRTDHDADGVLLFLEGFLAAEDGAAARAPWTDAAAFWAEVGDLERLAGQSLLRGLCGSLHAAPRPDGGFTVQVRWPAPPS